MFRFNLIRRSSIGNAFKSYTYDSAGRLATASVVGGGTSVLGYDYEDRVTSITGLRAPNTYAYNAMDARVSKTDSSGTSTYRRDGAGATSNVLFDGTATYVPGVSRHTGSGTRVYNPDLIGSNRVESDASGNAVATRVYDAYGNQTASTGTPSSPFGFAGAFGYQEDGDSGLKLLGHRLYDPTAGRFITRDPAQSGSNWYAYCDNNPLNSIDFNGLYRLIIVGNPKPGDRGEIDTMLGYSYKRPGDVILISPTEADIIAYLKAHPDVDEIVAIGHGGKRGVALRWDPKTGGATQYFSWATLDAADGKGHHRQYKRIILEACNQLICSLKDPTQGPGPWWQSHCDTLEGYDGLTDTAMRFIGFDLPGFPGTGHPKYHKKGDPFPRGTSKYKPS